MLLYLRKRFNFQEDELKGSILVVLANKQDIEGAMSVTEVVNCLQQQKCITSVVINSRKLNKQVNNNNNIFNTNHNQLS